jgi:hypothetical protein
MEAEHEALQMSTDFSEERVNDYIFKVDGSLDSYVQEVDSLYE